MSLGRAGPDRIGTQETRLKPAPTGEIIGGAVPFRRSDPVTVRRIGLLLGKQARPLANQEKADPSPPSATGAAGFGMTTLADGQCQAKVMRRVRTATADARGAHAVPLRETPFSAGLQSAAARVKNAALKARLPIGGQAAALR